MLDRWKVTHFVTHLGQVLCVGQFNCKWICRLKSPLRRHLLMVGRFTQTLRMQSEAEAGAFMKEMTSSCGRLSEVYPCLQAPPGKPCSLGSY